MSIAFVFSGQGSQKAGMGKELYDSYQVCREVFDLADRILDFPVSKICFEEDPRLNETEYTQPAILTMSIACMRLMEQSGINGEYFAGLSLGEYSALVASGAISFEEALVLVRKRGRFMTEAVPAGVGAMSAVMGLNREEVSKACELAGGQVYPANYNMPGQIVIAGEKEAVERAEKEAEKLGAKRMTRLNVSGPFHTPMLEPASRRLYEELNKIVFKPMKRPVVTNLTGDFIPDESEIIPTLTKQVISPVEWEKGIGRLIASGVDTFIELGPGKTLCSFIKKIDRQVKTYNIEDIKSYEKTLGGSRIEG